MGKPRAWVARALHVGRRDGGRVRGRRRKGGRRRTNANFLCQSKRPAHDIPGSVLSFRQIVQIRQDFKPRIRQRFHSGDEARLMSRQRPAVGHQFGMAQGLWLIDAPWIRPSYLEVLCLGSSPAARPLPSIPSISGIQSYPCILRYLVICHQRERPPRYAATSGAICCSRGESGSASSSRTPPRLCAGCTRLNVKRSSQINAARFARPPDTSTVLLSHRQTGSERHEDAIADAMATSKILHHP